MAELFRYAAFISYSSRDARFAQRLHRALETYGVPTSLGSFDLIGGGKKNRIYPVFRDREELSAGDLGDRIESALRASAALIVVCSPNAAESTWVEKEIAFFAGLGRSDKIFAIIADTAPLIDEAGADATGACFPPSFRGDALAGTDSLEPLAADARRGKDGFRNAWLKLVAGLVGVTPGQLIDRDRARRAQRRLQLGASATAVALIAATLFSLSDTLATRASLATFADDLINQTYSTRAATIAVASMAPRGAILSSSSVEAERVVSRAGLRVRWAAQTPGRYILNPPFLEFFFTAPGAPTVIDLEHNIAYEFVSDETSRGYSISSDKRFLALQQRAGEWSIVDRESGDARALSQFDDAFFGLGNSVLVAHSAEGWRAINLADAAETALGAGVTNVVPLFSGVWLLRSGESGPRALYRVADGSRQSIEPGEYHFLVPPGRPSLVITDDGPNAMVVRTADLARSVRASVPGDWTYTASPDLRFVLSSPAPRHVGQAALTDLESGRTIAIPREDRDSTSEPFSPDSRWLLRTENGVGVLRNLASGRATQLGVLEQGSTSTAFLAGGRMLITLQPSGNVGSNPAYPGRLHNLETGAVIDLGRLLFGQPYEVTGNGRYLIAYPRVLGSEVDPPPIQIIDLETGQRREIASAANFSVRSSNAAAKTRPLLGLADGRVINVATLETVATLAPDPSELYQRPMAFSSTDRYVWSPSRGFLDLDTGAVHAVAGVNDVTFSPDDRFAVLSRGDQFGQYNEQSLYRFEDGAEIELGRSTVSATFDTSEQRDSRWLSSGDDTGILIRDLNAPIMTEHGSTLRANVCAASSQALIPRLTGTDGDVDRRADALRGRPWNPCDWRGLGAVFPNADAGDGWFEGLRQWLRFTHVRLLGGRDWACEETTSAASALARAARASMCGRFGSAVETHE